MPKKQRGQSLQLDNLQEVLDAAPNSKRLGAQQFETPPDIAAALCLPLAPCRPVIADFQCAHGNLLRAAANQSTSKLLGIDIDPSARSRDYSTIIGDIGRVYPMLAAAGVKFDLLTLNPPFSLRWPRPNGSPGLIDSTLATWQMALDRLTAMGDGMMICNAATGQRLIGDDPAIWLRIDLPNFFPGTAADMRLWVLYFCLDGRREPDRPPVTITLQSAAPDAICAAVQPFADTRSRNVIASMLSSAPALPRKGRGITGEWHADASTAERFEAVRAEWKRLQDEERGKREWNISLRDDGSISRYLTPFQHYSGKAPQELVRELDSLHGRNPMELVVQRPTRLALQRAVSGGIWRVQPEVVAAVERAVQEYNAVRAPFIQLNPIQRIGYLDEEDRIRCIRDFDGFSAGAIYPLASETFEGRKLEPRKRLGQPPEQVLVSGMELMIKIADGLGRLHTFTQFPLKDQMEKNDLPVCHANHSLAALAEYFEIPAVPDVAASDPGRFEEYKRRLLALQT